MTHSPRPSTAPIACSLCGKQVDRRATTPFGALRENIQEHIRVRHPRNWVEEDPVCRACLGAERLDLVMSRLQAERGQLSEVEAEIARKAAGHETLAEHVFDRLDTSLSLGQRIADRMAAVGGSWPFVLGFLAFLGLWIAMNARRETFDPYPFILLNLLLSCLAALQAPVIMMSQNRLSQRDRLQADQDFRINLKAELEIASLHEKVDHLLHTQYEHMVELQEMQIELLGELTDRKR